MKVLFVQVIFLIVYQLQTVQAGGGSTIYNSSICTINKIWNGKNLCAVIELKTYEEAELKCLKNGMRL